MTRGNFAAAVRSLVQGVWTGALSPAQATGALSGAAQTYLREAWYAGAERCGILPGELTAEERSELLNFITLQQAFAGRFMQAVWQGREAVGGELGPLLSRAGLWVQRYHHARELGRNMACADRKAVWVYGDTLDHCDDCSRAEGRVHRRSVWQKYGWVPGSRRLACGGWRCDCRLEDTDAPALPGQPPRPRG